MASRRSTKRFIDGSPCVRSMKDGRHNAGRGTAKRSEKSLQLGVRQRGEGWRRRSVGVPAPTAGSRSDEERNASACATVEVVRTGQGSDPARQTLLLENRVPAADGSCCQVWLGIEKAGTGGTASRFTISVAR